MLDDNDSRHLVNGQTEIIQPEFLWGADAIGNAIGRTRRQAHYMLNNGEIKCAQKKGGRWVCSRAALFRELGAA
jgi:hypothetical protein